MNAIKKKNIPVLNLDTGEIFESCAEAEIFYQGKKTGNVNKVCKGLRQKFAGYRWKYLESSTMPIPSQA